MFLKTKIPLVPRDISKISKMRSTFFAFKIAGDIKKFRSDLENFVLSTVFFKLQKRQTTFWKNQDWGYFVFIVSRIVLVKLG